ncbi:hypothetical protein FLP41_07545 [Paracoccus marcusii]|uniref:hypothetical protein n=1 Tax=Paracoccus marcusii TaxID=59779 RepID=UPI002ED48223|nr:hypothetical protein FLP41_07545 [Paracoccus marcusii]
MRELRFAVVASDTFCRRNQNMGSDDSLAAFAAVAPMVGQAGRQLTGVIATAYGCPFEERSRPHGSRRWQRRCARRAPTGSCWPTRSASPPPRHRAGP